jgi:hypothetical protein
MAHRCTLLLIALLLSVPAVAQADLRVHAEIAGALLVDEYAREVEQWESDLGLATGVAAGWEWKTGRWSFVPEIGLAAARFTDPYTRSVFGIGGGLRVLWGTSFRPYLAAHCGWGMESGEDGDAMLEHRGLANDAALGLEVPFDKRWSMSAQLAYHVLLASTGSGTEPRHWPSAGIAFALRP